MLSKYLGHVSQLLSSSTFAQVSHLSAVCGFFSAIAFTHLYFTYSYSLIICVLSIYTFTQVTRGYLSVKLV